MKKLIAAYLNKLLYSQYWNIGFSNSTPRQIIEGNKIEIKWLKHSYHDRFFADPFFLTVNDYEIELLVEEVIFLNYTGRENDLIEKPKGTIVKLIIDRKSLKLKGRIEVLELDSHLSFPNIVRIDEDVYVYPENSNSGKLDLYRYENQTSKLKFVKTIIHEPLVDSCVFFYNGNYWLTATQLNSSKKDLYLYYSTTPFGEYIAVTGNPVISDEKCARPAGNIFCMDGHYYRPGQDCSQNYGGGIIIQEIMKLDRSGILLNNRRNIYPTSKRYNLGIHTINFSDNFCAIDGVGYLHPLCGYLFNYRNLKKGLSS